MSCFVAYHQRQASSDPTYAAALDAGEAATAGTTHARDMRAANANLDELVSP